MCAPLGELEIEIKLEENSDAQFCLTLVIFSYTVDIHFILNLMLITINYNERFCHY
jgi:hypothetical protein